MVNRLVKVKNLRVNNKVFSTSTKFKEVKINVGKYNINYLKLGNGTHIILCMPGALGSIWTDFKPQIEGFDREKFTLVAWEPPGYGKSRPPEREFPTDFHEKDAHVAYNFMKALNFSSKNGNLCNEFLHNVACPTFILYGEKDPLVDNVHVSHLHRHIQGSRIYLYPDGKHNIHIRYAKDFNKRVQEFLLEDN